MIIRRSRTCVQPGHPPLAIVMVMGRSNDHYLSLARTHATDGYPPLGVEDGGGPGRGTEDIDLASTAASSASRRSARGGHGRVVDLLGPPAGGVREVGLARAAVDVDREDGVRPPPTDLDEIGEESWAVRGGTDDAGVYALSAREPQVVAALIAGLDTHGVAGRLSISAYTVQDHLKSVFAKTGNHSRRELLVTLGSPAS